MNFNFLPTDNLYKFMALAGLFILIFNFYYSTEEIFKIEEDSLRFVWRAKEINEGQDRLIKEHKLQLSRLNHLTDLQTQAREHLERNTAVYSKFKLDENSTTEDVSYALSQVLKSEKTFDEKYGLIEQQMEALRGQINAAQKLLSLNDSLQAVVSRELRQTYDLLNLKEEKFLFFYYALAVGSVIGVFLTVFGFAKWHQLQKRQDQLLFKTYSYSHRRYPRKSVSK